ncbi:ABC transporter ATP-binding protein [Curvibacter sp. CHRR-16]|uniref:ABC transporter ATP-binding protein n=1 Tax=Curvibacter sp. CHRR-16 TaxID=2835872 RepID=UPI001BD936C5|nr:ATP-binding cassette domain-containing protein [Curvibacter sp. CHRR-16]MBT0568952.1 ABC transporter ATP-binding protein [Curvibacter sp. CHRR-16]
MTVLDMPTTQNTCADLRLHTDQLTVRLRSTGAVLVHPFTCQLRAGERLTIIGTSGAGKSLLLDAIMGTLPPEMQVSGAVQIGQHRTDGDPVRTQALWGSTVMMLPQEPWASLNPIMPLRTQVAEAAYYSGSAAGRWAVAQQTAQHWLQTLGVGHAGRAYLHQISGGMAQRVGLACTAATNALLVLADEPTKGLDRNAVATVAQQLLMAQALHQALVVVTHDLDLARQLGGQVLVMHEGAVVESGPCETVLQAPQSPHTQALVQAQPRHWPHRAHSADRASPVLQAHGLAKSFGDKPVFADVSLSLHAGTVTAVCGPSGCGKSTLGNVLLGLLPADAGVVQRADPSAPHWKFQKLYQDPLAAFSPYRQLGQAMMDVMRLHGIAHERLAQALAGLQLDAELLLRYPHQVSGGELQRLSIARMLLLQPQVIVADEATSRLDAFTQQQVMDYLMRCVDELQCAVLLITHDTDMAHAVADEVLVWGRDVARPSVVVLFNVS